MTKSKLTLIKQYEDQLRNEYLLSYERTQGISFEDYVFARVMKDRYQKGNPYAHMEYLEEEESRSTHTFITCINLANNRLKEAIDILGETGEHVDSDLDDVYVVLEGLQQQLEEIIDGYTSER